jgi:putative FmdB family regulatory protein
MPLYDYGCTKCDKVIEVFHKMYEEWKYSCSWCGASMRKMLTTGAVKRPDASWIKDVNGAVNDLTEVHRGRQEHITTREQARSAINRAYSDPHPRVQALKKRYLERF